MNFATLLSIFSLLSLAGVALGNSHNHGIKSTSLEHKSAASKEAIHQSTKLTSFSKSTSHSRSISKSKSASKSQSHSVSKSLETSKETGQPGVSKSKSIETSPKLEMPAAAAANFSAQLDSAKEKVFGTHSTEYMKREFGAKEVVLSM